MDGRITIALGYKTITLTLYSRKGSKLLRCERDRRTEEDKYRRTEGDKDRRTEGDEDRQPY